ncbi:MAG: hypothetical protein PHX20_07535 [Candidatus Omnitrophica bacterium]|nr:hypothetical protein [Candidatus Omnitrophota bacterium]MDD5437376.1 hypothetical protein [Candidatus Omnitrophota bacterium]
MKKTAAVIICVYAILLVAITAPFIRLAFIGLEEHIEASETFASWIYWLWLLALLACEIALLCIPVRVASKRPVTKRHIFFPIIAGSFMMALLVAGAFLAIGEFIREDALYEPMWWLALSELVLGWMLWGLVFFRWSRVLKPENLIEKQIRYLYKGSILELLIAVPTHVMVRSKDYCCAGYATFISLALGFSVMLIAFGPGIFFLFSERWAKKKRMGGR